MDTIEYMRHNLPSLIYSEALIEGMECGFDAMEEILACGSSNLADDTDTSMILGLQRAWEYLFEHYRDPITFEHFVSYNILVQDGYKPNGGKIRTDEITISGTDYVPIPCDENHFYDIIETATQAYSSYSDQALVILFLLCKAQVFWDGNKRSSQLIVNHHLAQQNSGKYLMIPAGNELMFHDDLVRFYEGKISLDDVTWLDDYVWNIGS